MAFTIAHVNVSQGYRGGERQTELLIQGLERSNLRQILVARKDGLLVKHIKSPGLEIRPVSGNRLSIALACKGADIVHVHEGRSVYGAYLRSLSTGTPYIVTRRVNNPLGNHWLAHKAYRQAAIVAAVAPQVGDVIRQFDPEIDPHVVHSSASGLEADEATSKSIRDAYRRNLLVGHVGALDNDQKGQKFIIDVARQLEKSHPEIHFMLVGDGKDEKTLKAEAAGLPNLTFVGFVENVGDYLAAFDVFILPSLKEGIGSILLDAMEQSLPIVASDVGGVPEIVHDGENGILIQPGRSDQLKAAILRLSAEPNLRAEMGRCGKMIATRFTSSTMCEKYLNLYRSILGITA
jgi:glycosyltransferase involved in cell wall biosynthesis